MSRESVPHAQGDDREAEVIPLCPPSPQKQERDRLSETASARTSAHSRDTRISDRPSREAERTVPDETKDSLIEALEPWPDPVDGAALAEQIRCTLEAHVVFGDESDPDVATLWVMGSYLMDSWRLWPRLMITSPTKQCGKSTLLEAIEAVAHRGLMVSNIKSAGVFRVIEAWRPTLLMDEADTWMKADDELTGILNSGHTRRSAKVVRVEEKKGGLFPKEFSTWCAMAIAGIGTQRDTLMSRSIVISLRRKLPDETVVRMPVDLYENKRDLRRKALRWALDHAAMLRDMSIEPPPCGNDRRQDNFTPLWRIAHLIGDAWPERIEAAYRAAGHGEEEEEATGVLLLRDLMELFGERPQATALPSSELLQSLIAMEERPWSEWRNGRAITLQGIAKLLKPFKIRPINIRHHSNVVKGYQRSDIRAAFTRYVLQPLHRYNDEKNE